MNSHWSDVLGNYVSAADVLRQHAITRASDEELAAWIERQSQELWGADHRTEDWAMLARQLCQDAAKQYGTVEYEGKSYILLAQADFSNRPFVGWWGDAQEGEPYTTEFSCEAVDDDGDRYVVYWQFDTLKGQEPELDGYPWDDAHITSVKDW